VIIGEITQPLNDSLGFIGIRANVKGFLCEYMTDGRVLVLGDPGLDVRPDDGRRALLKAAAPSEL
jgi:hypothetical protein